MSKLLALRQQLNITQEELCEKSGVSVRTIQRIEAGTAPKGYTLKALAKGLGVSEADLLDEKEKSVRDESTWLKVINLSPLPFIVIPPLNIAAPLLLMFWKNQFTPTTRQIVTIQILWTLVALLLLLLIMMLNDWFAIQSKFTLLVPIVWVLLNGFVVLRNAAEIAKNNTLRISLKFSLL
ncbi:transcriptional regulator with XRE-family HTH domain [Rhabdobacter roseus]|uniref:Transcriptional regulator with XRE-family HTH domain n=1 Tax=Rhabdobacter roseus TaxID=1655419 RepID=A0A840TVF4_9BACT|nr:helix-turn-helix transcriptional regulator [Rhabdobacter roseus]MBB5283930.1 transcriptional regulator with XRE-family HTH domain [Rhabdobacter roseus]